MTRANPSSSSSSATAADATSHNGWLNMDSLRGKLLLASPTMADPNFARSVVLIAEHTEEGAMGLVLNRPAETTVAEAVPDLAWLADDDAQRVRRRPGRRDRRDRARGVRPARPRGRARRGRPRLHRRRRRRRRSSSTAPSRRARVFAGHAGWGPGQLEDELAEDAWIVEPPRREEVFTEEPGRPVGGGAAAQGAPLRAALHDAAGPVAQLSYAATAGTRSSSR